MRRLRGQILAKFRQISGFLHLNRDPARPEGALLGQILPNLALGTPFQGSWGPPSRGPGQAWDQPWGPPKRAFPGPTPGFPVFGGSPGLNLGQNRPFLGLGTPLSGPGDPPFQGSWGPRGPPSGTPERAKFGQISALGTPRKGHFLAQPRDFPFSGVPRAGPRPAQDPGWGVPRVPRTPGWGVPRPRWGSLKAVRGTPDRSAGVPDI